MSKVRLVPLDSDCVKAFLPANTWTEVILLSQTPVCKDVYACTTEEKLKDKVKFTNLLSSCCENCEKVEKYSFNELVAVEVDKKWRRGKTICFNEFLPDNENTIVELIDDGSFYATNIDKIFVLPYFTRQKPLALFVKFKNFVPKSRKLIVKPLLSESMLLKGYVFVDVKLEETHNEKQPEKQIVELTLDNDIDVKKMTNGFGSHCSVKNSTKDYTAELKPSLWNGGFPLCQRKVEKKLPFRNGDYCVLTHFDNFMSMYVCPADKNPDIVSFKESDVEVLKEIETNKDFTPKKYPVVGNVVKVVSPVYNVCRAKIFKKTEDNRYDVVYIDFGNVENVPSSAIFELDEILKNKPGIAVRVGMDDLKHLESTEEVKEMFRQFYYTLLVIEFNEDSNNLKNVKLKEPSSNGKYINDLFSHQKPERMNVTQVIENTTIIKNDTTLKNDMEMKQLSSLHNKDKVYLKHFENMENVYILRAADVGFFNETVIRIVADKSICKKDISVGDIVKVFYDDTNYRARVMKVGIGLATVMSVDLGFTETVNVNYIYELSEKLQKVSSKLFKVGIKNPILTKTMELDDFIHDSETVLLCVEFDENDPDGRNNSILRNVVSSENIFDEFLSIYKYNEPVLNNGVLSQDQDNIATDDFQTVNVENGDYCVITNFESLESIYVCKAVKAPDNSYVSHNFDVIIKTMECKDRRVKINISEGDFVKVMSPKFNDMYRAKIIDIIDYTKFQVFYIDFGNKEIVQSSDIYELSDELKIKTKLPLRVAIDVPSKVKKTKEIDNLFSNVIDNGVVLSINFETKNSSGFDNVVLEEVLSGKSINQEILQLLPAENKMTLKNFDICALSHFENFDNIYVSKEENMNIVFDTINSLDRNIKTNLAVGDLVKVFSTLYNDILHRATIMNLVDREHIQVYYIDFGSTEVVPMTKVYELSESLKIQPGIAIKVGIKVPNNVKLNEEIKKLFLTLSDELVSLTVEFDDSCEKGLENCTLKVKSSGINLIDEILKLSDQPPVSIDLKEPPPRTSPDNHKISQDNNETKVNEKLTENSLESESTSSVELKSGDIVFCCNFEDFNNVYLCKISKSSAEPENFKFIIDASTVKNKIKKKNLHCEDLVEVEFENKVFRARVLNKRNNEYTVFLIDIGKKITVSGDNIYELSDDSKNIPGLAKKVGLKEVRDLNITKTVIEYFNCLWYTDKIPLILTYNENNFNYINEVSLKKLSDGRNIIDDLVNIIKLLPTADGFQTNHIKSVEHGSKIVNGSANNWRIVSGDKVEFLNAFSVEHVFVRCTRIYDDFKHNLELLKQVKKENLKPKEDPIPRETVAVYYPKFKGVCRGSVLSTETPGKIRCKLVDLGICDFFPSQYVFELPSEFTQNKIPFLSHKVTLKGLTKTFGSNTNEINSYLLSFVGKNFVLEYEKSDCQWNSQVVLKEIGSNVSLNEEIKRIPVNSISQRLEKKIIVVEKNKVEPKKNLHPIDSGSFVHLTHFEDFNAIFIRNASMDFVPKFGKLNKKLITLYRNATNDCSMVLHIGDKVCVSSCLNNISFSRACILNKFGNGYNVFYLDYGNTEFVGPEDIFELTKELKEIPDFAIKVQLKNVPPLLVNKVGQVKDYIKKKFVLPNTIFKIDFNETNPEGLNEVILKIGFDNKNIVDVLVELCTDAPLLNTRTTGNAQVNMDQLCQRPPNSPYLSRKNCMSSK